MYTNLYSHKGLERKYGEEMMSVSVKDFQTYAVPTNDRVRQTHEMPYDAWIVSVQFNRLRISNTVKYWLRDTAMQIDQDPHRRGEIVNFCAKHVF